MMDFLDLVNKRYSCRNYRDAAVEPEKLLHVMECVRMAPSAVNHQPWRFYVVDSVEGRVALHRCYALGRLEKGLLQIREILFLIFGICDKDCFTARRSLAFATSMESLDIILSMSLMSFMASLTVRI